MPETAIDEHRHPGLCENEIRSPKNGPMPPPAADALSPKHPHQRQLSVPVPVRPGGQKGRIMKDEGRIRQRHGSVVGASALCADI
jgi:hypothetical protein